MPQKVEECVQAFMASPSSQQKWPDEPSRRRAAYAICTAAMKNGERRDYLSPLILEESEDNTSWVHLLPYGKFGHPVFGDLEITEQKIDNFIKNFRRNVRGIMLDVDYAHKTDTAKGAKAAGWIVKLEKRNDGLWGLVSWTPEAQREIREGSWKYMSVEYQDRWCDPENKCYDDVLFGAALTNRPFMKRLNPINLEEVVQLEGFEVPEGLFEPEEVKYRQAYESTYRCANCAFFRDGSCLVVSGEINPDYVCDYFRTIVRQEETHVMMDSIALRDFSPRERERLAKEGKALPDGSFPIVNREDLINAKRLLHLAKDKAQARRHIIKRARELGLMDLVKDLEEVNMEELLSKIGELLGTDVTEETVVSVLSERLAETSQQEDSARKFAEDYPEEAKALEEARRQLKETRLGVRLDEWHRQGLPPALDEEIRSFCLSTPDPIVDKFNSIMSALLKTGLVNFEERGASTPQGDRSPSAMFLERVKQYSTEHNVTMSEAVRAIAKENPDLAKDYLAERPKISRAGEVS